MALNKEDLEHLDDDCPICRAMKEGRAETEEELIEAFREAKRQGKGITWIKGEDGEM